MAGYDVTHQNLRAPRLHRGKELGRALVHPKWNSLSRLMNHQVRILMYRHPGVVRNSPGHYDVIALAARLKIGGGDFVELIGLVLFGRPACDETHWLGVGP